MDIQLAHGNGIIHRHPDFASRRVEARNIDVWLPPGYSAVAAARYPVIYMHDGQNLFDPALAYGGVDWGMPAAMVRVMRDRHVRGAIIVGIWNSGEGRWCDYMPARPLTSPAAAELLEYYVQEHGGPPHSDQYLRFLVREVKPFIDATYRTLRGRAHTHVMGSSLGGLISLYALVEHPHIFGGAACLSTHWPAGGDLLVDALAAALPRPGAHKLYFDFGTATLDADYEPYQRRMDAFGAAAGYTPGKDWLTRKFPGAEHSEKAWRKRVHIPLQFLLGQPPSTHPEK